MSLVPAFPVTATTSSHPLGRLFLTDLCISYMRKTSTSVLVCLTGKCCNHAQLSNTHRLSWLQSPAKTNEVDNGTSDATGAAEEETQQLAPSAEFRTPTPWKSTLFLSTPAAGSWDHRSCWRPPNANHVRWFLLRSFPLWDHRAARGRRGQQSPAAPVLKGTASRGHRAWPAHPLLSREGPWLPPPD